MRYVFKLWICLLGACVGCEDKKDNKDNQYDYTAYFGKSLVVCAEGTMEINIDADSSITGKWRIEARGGYTENSIGPQFGEGNLEGIIKDGQTEINLNPSWNDHNVYLYAIKSNSDFSGTWNYSAFVGSVASGSFKIIN